MIWVFILACVAGVLGRMGGATGYNTKFRDLGVPLCLTIALLILDVKAPWWAFLLAFGAVFGALTTYYDELFGYDNLWFSGLIVGIASFPITLFTATGHLWIRAVGLALIWGILNKYLPNIKRRDVVEEFLRYFCVVATAFLLT
jgi:hypothetical protein